MALTILEGSTFCICDERGDIDGQTHGLFADDTRFLSLLRLTVNGEKPLLLSSGKVDYFSAAFYLRNPIASGPPHDTASTSPQPSTSPSTHDPLATPTQHPTPPPP